MHPTGAQHEQQEDMNIHSPEEYDDEAQRLKEYEEQEARMAMDHEQEEIEPEEYDGEHHYQDPIQEKIQKIIQVCKDNDALFGDSEFPAND